MENILEVKGLGKSFGGFTALSDVSLSIRKGERLGLIGPNGSGKTTLINCSSGALRNDQGSIEFLGKPVGHLPAFVRTRRGIARSFQIPRPFHSMTVLENLMVPLAYVGGVSGRKARQRGMEILNDIGLGDKAEAKIGRAHV